MAWTEPGRIACCWLFGKRSERSEIHPLSASSAVQMTSPRIMSSSSPPACIWVLSLFRRSPVSELPSRKMTLYLPLFFSLNRLISLVVVPVASAGAVKYSLVVPPLCSSLVQPAPRNAAPASPAPPALRKSLRESTLGLQLPFSMCSSLLYPSSHSWSGWFFILHSRTGPAITLR